MSEKELTDLYDEARRNSKNPYIRMMLPSEQVLWLVDHIRALRMEVMALDATRFWERGENESQNRVQGS